MPIKKSDYPPNWSNEIVPAVLARAGEVRENGRIVVEAKCEWCGAPNHSWILRFDKPVEYRTVQYAGAQKIVPDGDFFVQEEPSIRSVRIVLSTSHLDRDRTNNELDNLASLCQRCHLNHDRMAQHIPNRAYGRYHSRQPKLLFPKDE